MTTDHVLEPTDLSAKHYLCVCCQSSCVLLSLCLSLTHSLTHRAHSGWSKAPRSCCFSFSCCSQFSLGFLLASWGLSRGLPSCLGDCPSHAVSHGKQSVFWMLYICCVRLPFHMPPFLQSCWPQTVSHLRKSLLWFLLLLARVLYMWVLL